MATLLLATASAGASPVPHQKGEGGTGTDGGGSGVEAEVDDDVDLRWESVACVLDAMGVPLAWGVASAVRGVQHVASVAAVPLWALRALADAYFVPVDDCAEWSVECARGVGLMAMIHADRFELGLCVDEALAAIAAVLLGLPAAASRRRLLVHPLKAAAVLSAPGGGTLGYFLAVHLEWWWRRRYA